MVLGIPGIVPILSGNSCRSVFLPESLLLFNFALLVRISSNIVEFIG